MSPFTPADHHPTLAALLTRMGNWEQRPLSRDQRAYAALDAFMGGGEVGSIAVVLVCSRHSRCYQL
jgi:hypothetical protein